MSVCKFLAADCPLPLVSPSVADPLEINLDNGVVYDGGSDDNYCLYDFPDVRSYTNKKYGVCLEWHYTEGRAIQIIEYIKNILKLTDTVELWHVWLMEYYEFEERPYIHRRTISAHGLTPQDIMELDRAESWNHPDKNFPERPSFYCLNITK